ncbi:MAG: V-type ATPase subunit [Defluviitaleaceae bacterium]|nr:V-type ATPase subunit [Defluviitaleaceae bacterium]
MNYITAKTKIKAMSAKLLSTSDYDKLCRTPTYDTLLTRIDVHISLLEAFERISSYVYLKPVRKFLKIMTNALNGRGQEDLEITHWTYILWCKLHLLDKPSRDSLRCVLGTEIDLRNILWIYRLKRFHKVEGSGAIGYLLPVRYRLNNDTLTALLTCKDITSLIEVLSQSPYRKIFASTKDFHLGEQRVANKVKAQFQKESFGVNATCICKYLYEKHLEIRNIQAISEGVKFGFAPEEILLRLY